MTDELIYNRFRTQYENKPLAGAHKPDCPKAWGGKFQDVLPCLCDEPDTELIEQECDRVAMAQEEEEDSQNNH